MKQQLMMVSLAVLISCLGTGCKIGGCVERRSSSYASFSISPLDFVVLAAALPVYLGDELYVAASEYCENKFYDYPGNRASRGRCWERLYCAVVTGGLQRPSSYDPPDDFFHEFDDRGVRKEGFYVFTMFMDSEQHAYALASHDAQYVARLAVDDPSLMEWVPKIWSNPKIWLELRNEALDRLRYRNSTNEELFKMILDNSCYTDGMLEKIMQTTTNEHESRAAYKILCARVEPDKSK